MAKKLDSVIGKLSARSKAFLSTLANSGADGELQLDSSAAVYAQGLALFDLEKIPIDDNVFVNFNKAMSKKRMRMVNNKPTNAPLGINTRRLYLTALRKMLDWMEASDKLPAAFSRRKADALYRTVVKGKNKPMMERKHAHENIPDILEFWDNMPLPSSPKEKRQRITVLRNRALLHTLYSSAGRVSEVAKLTRSLVRDGKAQLVEVPGKGGKVRKILLSKDAQDAIRAYVREREDTGDALFASVGRGAGGGLTRKAIWAIVGGTWHEVAIELYPDAKERAHIKPITPHSFRHYRATQLLKEGMDLPVLQEFLGHDSPETTRKFYAEVGDDLLLDQFSTFTLSPRDARKKK